MRYLVHGRLFVIILLTIQLYRSRLAHL